MRTTALILLGAVAGAAAYYVVTTGPTREAAELAEPGAVEADRDVSAQQVSRAEIVSDAADTDPAQAFALARARGAERELLAASEQWAALDARRALAAALELQDPGLRNVAVARVGAAWARSDPRAALAAATTLPFDARAGYLDRVGSTWADLDPAAFLDHAYSAANVEELAAGLERLIAADPESVFEIVRPLGAPRSPRLGALQADAVRAMVERDPQPTLARLESIAGGAGASVLRDAADAYARLDADAALAWVDTLEPRVGSAEQAVIAAIAETDFARAYALEAALDEPLFGPSGSALNGATRDPRNMPAVATALIGRDDQRAPQLLSSLLSTWVMRDTEGAIDWMIANEGGLDAAFARSVANRLARADLDTAMRNLDRLPPQWRDAWAAQVARAYAAQDVAAAVDWVSGFRGQAHYEQALAEVVMQAGSTDPAFAARYVEELSGAVQGEAAVRVASTWVLEDAAAATQWATGLTDPELAATATRSMVFRWLQVEPRAAERWVLEAPRGRARDEALKILMGQSDIGDYDPTRFLGEFSSAAQREDGVRYAVGMLSAREPELARALLGAVIDDPALGRWAEERLGALDGGR